MKHIFLILLCLLYIPIYAFTVQGHIISIDDSVNQRILPLEELFYLEDKDGKFSFSEVSGENFQNRFKKNPSYNTNDFNPNITYWVKLDIKHNKDSKKIWLFEFYDQTIDEIIAYIPLNDGKYERKVMGDLLPFSQRQYRHKNFEVLIENGSNDIKTYYFRIRSHNSADIRIVLRSMERFIYYVLNEYFLYGIFYGMIIIISLYNMLMFFAVKEKKYLYYIFYILSVAIYAMSIDGTAYQYLWSNSPGWNQIAFGVALYSIILWALIFAREFLNTKKRAPKIHQAINTMIILRSIWFLISIVFNHSLFDLRIIEIIPLSLVFYAGGYTWMKGFKAARFFVLAYGLLFISFLVKGLVTVGWIPFWILLHYSLHLGFLVEMLLLSFALGDKVRIINNIKEKAQRRIIKQYEINANLKDQVNKELEQKVKERTIELANKARLLEEANVKLIKQGNEINQINSILDLDNWKLKNNIKEVIKERLLNKHMPYQEFKTVFPDELACYRYLDELKWKSGYSCKQCGNDKFFGGTKKFSRRCTKCGYNESVSAYTIFHGIKFPIDKAFYIAYVVMSKTEELTLEQIASELQLRVNTVWSFKNKIKEIANHQSHDHSSITNSWIVLKDEIGKTIKSHSNRFSKTKQIKA